ncbi:HTH_48 domain-containing protein [Trichonephila inaurata madagascariensis]|uniref:HTH_48 domain-containing protein n=1 Tax=Trichonephila inaurata madagascariensis TaxID=2747483 RepID=A0A8X6IHD5_9ARAC|nr:HTH_48 domain-containing protein [Trichonephila inaurata madagascariensis]
MKSAGADGKGTVFLITDSQIKEESFLEDIDNLLNSGEVPNLFAVDEKQEKIEEDGRQTSRELAKKMNCNHKTILNHLPSMGFAEKLRVLVPHELNENSKENRLQIASQHLARHRATRCHKQHFWCRIVTGDEKWGLYINMKQYKEVGCSRR